MAKAEPMRTPRGLVAPSQDAARRKKERFCGCPLRSCRPSSPGTGSLACGGFQRQHVPGGEKGRVDVVMFLALSRVFVEREVGLTLNSYGTGPGTPRRRVKKEFTVGWSPEAFTALLWRAGAGHGDEVPLNKDDSFGRRRMRGEMLLLLSRTVIGTR